MPQRTGDQLRSGQGSCLPPSDAPATTDTSRDEENLQNLVELLGESDAAEAGVLQLHPSLTLIDQHPSARMSELEPSHQGSVTGGSPHCSEQGRSSNPSQVRKQDRSMNSIQHVSGKQARIAEAGDQYIVSDNSATLLALLRRRKGALNDELRMAAATLGIDITEFENEEQPLAQQADQQDQASPDASQAQQRVSDRSRTAPGTVAGHHRLHLGSAKPHEALETAVNYARAKRAAPTSSARNIESEGFDVLVKEPFNIFNKQRFTQPEPEPEERSDSPPGPFTTDQLIPQSAIDAVKGHREAVIGKVLDRAGRGPNGWRVAKNLRPEPLILSEEEALNLCGRGYVWVQPKQEVDEWHALGSKRSDHGWPNRSAHSIDIEAFIKRAARDGLADHRLISWMKYDFPGPSSMPTNIVCIGSQHVGALKHVHVYKEINQRDVQNEFVTSGRPFPEFWPTIVDYTNLVMQHGKGRITIDKSIRLSSTKHPEPLSAYNDYIDLEADRASGGDLELFSAVDFCRAAAILMTACRNSESATVKFGKWDKGTFFRMHQKRLSAIPWSGRLNHDGFGHDWRVNFGEREAMDHCCAASDATAFFVRKELMRIEKEYPIGDAAVEAWLLERSMNQPEGELSIDQLLQWATTFVFAFFVDDANLLAIAAPLKRRDGSLVQEIDPDGRARQVCRADFMLAASRGVAIELGYDVPDKKFFPMGLDLDCIGCGIYLADGREIGQARRYLPAEKRERYLKNLQQIETEATRLLNGLLAFERSDLNSLVHKLIHASATDVLGRPNLHHIRKALREYDRDGNQLERDAVIMPKQAMREFDWWKARLDKPVAALPLASRLDFPSSSAGTLIQYTDASREMSFPEQSGLGGWTVLDGEFLYVVDRWSADEVAAFSINTMEAFTKDAISSRFIQEATSKGRTITHVQSYNDNATAEMVAENGRTQSDAMAELQKRRIERNLELRISETTERVSSADNVVADLLSRGDVSDALRFATMAKLPVTRLHLSPEQRDMSWLPRTWE